MTVKICDFGLARGDFDDLQWKMSAMTDYVATRWYRAPEIILSWRKYSKAVDLWAVGCILGELLSRRPVFPGADSQGQIKLIVNFTGTPTKSELEMIKHPKARVFVEGLPKAEPANLKEQFPDANPDAIDMLRGLLQFDPAKRLSIDDCLRHPYMATLHCPTDEPVGDPIPREEFRFEHLTLTTDEYRELIIEEINSKYGGGGEELSLTADGKEESDLAESFSNLSAKDKK